MITLLILLGMGLVVFFLVRRIRQQRVLIKRLRDKLSDSKA